ncbi:MULTISPECIES: murein biosynthesis integral membrane protein MurJ [unclassified Streptomyces]|uniref:murein biosynthesis integral membrane protein MurJ n=1 Tax=unclassified Streptomyces TaxID=2593676 RepID=UPI00382D0E2E
MPTTTDTAEPEAAPKAAPTAGHRRLRPGPELLMAAGAVASRATGFLRAAVVVAALGSGMLADGYNVANTVPNILFILLIGGALNTVLVPHLVAAAQQDPDGGAAAIDRLLTLLAAAVLALTVVTTAAAPWIVDAYTSYSGAQRQLTLHFAYLCLPQIFFYGIFTMLGQVLNARGRFGPMAWTPVLNNLIVSGVFGLYLVCADDVRTAGEMTSDQVKALGVGTTLGIVVQALALLPVLRAVGVRWRPRFDWRGSGLGAPLGTAGWTLLMVLTDQIGYWLVTRLSTRVAEHADAAGVGFGVGYTTYSNAYLLWIVPHGVFTVSLITAALPRMSEAATAADLPRLRGQVSEALRRSGAFIVPATFAFLALAPQIATVAFGHGRTNPGDVHAIALTLMAFAPGLLCYSANYTLSRTLYALRDGRTPFLLNLIVFAVNGLGVTASYLLLPTRWAVVGMALSFGLAFTAAALATAWLLRRRLGGLDGRRIVRTHALLTAASACAAAMAYGIAHLVPHFAGNGLPGTLLGLLGGAVPLLGVVVLARRRL